MRISKPYQNDKKKSFQHIGKADKNQNRRRKEIDCWLKLISLSVSETI